LIQVHASFFAQETCTANMADNKYNRPRQPNTQLTNQTNITIFVNCKQVSGNKYSCILYGARKLHKKRLAQESMTYARETFVASFWYKFLEKDFSACVTPITLEK